MRYAYIDIKVAFDIAIIANIWGNICNINTKTANIFTWFCKSNACILILPISPYRHIALYFWRKNNGNIYFAILNIWYRPCQVIRPDEVVFKPKELSLVVPSGHCPKEWIRAKFKARLASFDPAFRVWASNEHIRLIRNWLIYSSSPHSPEFHFHRNGILAHSSRIVQLHIHRNLLKT